MKLENKSIGVAFTGSFCTYEKAFRALGALMEEKATVQTIFSDNAGQLDSRFGKAADFLKKAEDLTGHPPILTIPDIENRCGNRRRQQR